MPLFFLIFIAIPLIELALLIQVGNVIGLWNTIAVVLLTGALGAFLARTQGLMAWMRIQQEINSGKMPSDALFDGVLILVGGIVLLTPGLLTDAFGFFLLIPAGRTLIKNFIRKQIETRQRHTGSGPGRTINITEFEVKDEEEK